MYITKLFIRNPDGVSVREVEGEELLDLVDLAEECGPVINTPTLIMFDKDRETTMIIQSVWVNEL